MRLPDGVFRLKLMHTEQMASDSTHTRLRASCPHWRTHTSLRRRLVADAQRNTSMTATTSVEIRFEPCRACILQQAS